MSVDQTEKESGWTYYTFTVPGTEDQEIQCLCVITAVMNSLLKNDAQAKKRILEFLLARSVPEKQT